MAIVQKYDSEMNPIHEKHESKAQEKKEKIAKKMGGFRKSLMSEKEFNKHRNK